MEVEHGLFVELPRGHVPLPCLLNGGYLSSLICLETWFLGYVSNVSRFSGGKNKYSISSKWVPNKPAAFEKKLASSL